MAREKRMEAKAIKYGVNRMQKVIDRASKVIEYELKVIQDAEREIQHLQKSCKHTFKQDIDLVGGATINTCEICGFVGVG